MISLYWLAQWASNNAQLALQEASTKSANRLAMQKALCSPPPTRLMQACRKNGPRCMLGSWEAIFLALPERMLASASYFVGDTKSAAGRPTCLKANVREQLEELRSGGQDLRFENVSDHVLPGIKRLLLCHGLSAAGDSVLLLAEVGRACRLGSALGLPVEVMLTDSRWQVYNRSLLQLRSLTASDMERALLNCQQQRLKLYANLNMSARTYFVDASKLDKMAQFYRQLAGELWQVPTEGCLSIEQRSHISHCLPTHLESKHQLELPLLRFVASHFSGFDREYFWYFFSQFAAQSQFGAESMKIAVESELKFDLPFARLSEAMAAWASNGDKRIAADNAQKLPGVYLPQYRLGTKRMLPYTPLSLDAFDESVRADHLQLAECAIMLSCAQSPSFIASLLATTPLADRNRLAADLTSFIAACAKTSAGSAILRHAEKATGVYLSECLSQVDPRAPEVFNQEVSLVNPLSVQSFWLTGLQEALTCEIPPAMPLHLRFNLLEEGDWTADVTLAVAHLCRLARELHAQLVS